MFTTRRRAPRALAGIALLLLGVLTSWHVYPARGSAEEPPPPRGGVPADREARLKALLEERLAVAREMAEMKTRAYNAGTVPYSQVREAKLAVFRAELDLCEKEKDRVTVLEKMVAEMKQFEEQVAQLHKRGTVSASAVFEAKLARLEAEIALERARAKAADPTK